MERGGGRRGFVGGLEKAVVGGKLVVYAGFVWTAVLCVCL